MAPVTVEKWQGYKVSDFPARKNHQDLSDETEDGAKLVSIVRACCYFAGSLDPQESLGEREQRFISFYIVEYLNWQFSQRTGVSLDTFVEYLKD